MNWPLGVGHSDNRQVCLGKASENNICPEALGGKDAFTLDWVGELNWLVSPLSLIGKIVKNIRSSKIGCNFSLPILDINQFFL